ncbi:MAG: tetratricopeptide repeat protein, partial [Gallionellaceae bacterium]|nr:tetratricopeptide repeat protein [Gallionellaceae bacterium]
MKPGRNDPCPCGSGKKYKHCCQLRSNPLGKNTSAAAIQTALEHHRAGHLAEAEEIYNQVLHTDPAHPDALHYLGTIATDQGRYKEAVELIGRAIQVRPSRSMYYNQGNALRELNRLDEAAESFRRALVLDPNYAEAYTNLGGVLLVQHKLEEAVESYRRALELKPRFTETYPSARSNLLFLYGYHITLD